MLEAGLALRPVRSTPAGTDRRGAARRALPEDLLRQASRRLGILALVAASLWLIAPLAGHAAALALGDPRWAQLDFADHVSAFSCAVSIALVLYVRSSTRSPVFILDLGLAYLVLTALELSIMMHWSPIPEDWKLNPMISWIGPVMLMFAAIVPVAPRKMLVAGFITASMEPVGMWVSGLAGHHPFGSLGDGLVMHYPNYLLLGVTVVISHVVTRLGQQVASARELGSYRLGELLGRGGMGEVYTATHRMLARTAAIKLIRPEMIGAVDSARAELAIKRFRREAEAAANLRSPHTVELYDFGIAEDRTLYFVMELLDRLDLETLVQQFGPVPADRALYILVQACASLAEAHARGLVHRDIKPANIHLGRMGLEHDFVKVLDFGLVKSVTGNVAESRETAAGIAPGTPAYMAPEMALGDSVDGRADLYALGCVAYWLVTGRLVFEAASPLQVIARHLNEVPVPPSARTQQDIPPALDRLILSCLAKKPEQRPASADELASALRAVPVREAWTEAKAARWWSTNRPAARHENRGVRGHAVATAVVPGNS